MKKNLQSDIIVARAFKPLPIILNLLHNNFRFFKEVILFLGKNGKKILQEALLEWKFEYEIKKSITSHDLINNQNQKFEKKNERKNNINY